ncbi:hypothetical protein FOMA001_g19101 [Fusarium oxysporum f. sp. matthiolae]|nr:hypothetical protein FOMA001_g19101 [Fusarium oxysporum f. sp. matthiolae]
MASLYDNHDGGVPAPGEFQQQLSSERWLRDRAGNNEQHTQYEWAFPREFAAPQRTNINMCPRDPPS